MPMPLDSYYIRGAREDRFGSCLKVHFKVRGQLGETDDCTCPTQSWS
jgi:hypothetical protein